MSPQKRTVSKLHVSTNETIPEYEKLAPILLFLCILIMHVLYCILLNSTFFASQMYHKIITSSSKIQFRIMVLKFSISMRGSPQSPIIILPTLPVHNNHTAQQKPHAVFSAFTVIQVINVSFIKSNQSSASYVLALFLSLLQYLRLHQTSRVYPCVYYETLIPMWLSFLMPNVLFYWHANSLKSSHNVKTKSSLLNTWVCYWIKPSPLLLDKNIQTRPLWCCK